MAPAKSTVTNKSTVTKARTDLEELYSGVPDDSVNLTFQDLAEVRQSNGQKIPPPLDPFPDASPRTEEVYPLARMPSLDFIRGLEGPARSDHPFHYQNQYHHHSNNNRPHVFPLPEMEDSYNASPAINHLNRPVIGVPSVQQYQNASPYSQASQYSKAGFSPAMGASMCDDMSQMSCMTPGEKAGRRRPGIPHSNICTVCSNYIYIFRHRCLVCGRVYCRQCVNIGMGEMSEGRKCIECLGRKFSPRYIQRAGSVGCCTGYPSAVKQQELIWAEKGARKTGENRHAPGGMVSQSMKFGEPRTPGRPYTPTTTAPTSFVISSPYSPYHSSTNHPLPF